MSDLCRGLQAAAPQVSSHLLRVALAERVADAGSPDLYCSGVKYQNRVSALRHVHDCSGAAQGQPVLRQQESGVRHQPLVPDAPSFGLPDGPVQAGRREPGHLRQALPACRRARQEQRPGLFEHGVLPRGLRQDVSACSILSTCLRQADPNHTLDCAVSTRTRRSSPTSIWRMTSSRYRTCTKISPVCSRSVRPSSRFVNHARTGGFYCSSSCFPGVLKLTRYLCKFRLVGFDAQFQDLVHHRDAGDFDKYKLPGTM